MAKEQWDVRSNLKNKPNAQGTLFSGGAAQMNPAKRYKKGYTPERQRAVLDNVRVHDLSKDAWEPEANSHRAREAYETIKRSSVPIEHLNGLRINILSPQTDVLGRLKNGVDGSYRGNGEYSYPRGEISLSHAARQPTLLHEIGHHASHLDKTPHSAYNTPWDRGSEEGFADRYADEHAPKWSTDAGHSDRFADAYRRGYAAYQPQYWQTKDRNGEQRPEHFAAGYAQARPMETRVPNSNDRWRDQSQGTFEAGAQRRATTPMLPDLDHAAIMRQASEGTSRPPAPRATASGQLPPPPPPAPKKTRGPLRRLDD
jgi:hypothetical protein